MWWRRKAKQAPPIRRARYSPSKRGKTRVNPASVRSFNRRFEKSKNRMTRAGFTFTGGKPVNAMNDREFSKLMKKVNSGNYDVRTIHSPPKWEGEPPRQWVLTRRRK